MASSILSGRSAENKQTTEKLTGKGIPCPFKIRAGGNMPGLFFTEQFKMMFSKLPVAGNDIF